MVPIRRRAACLLVAVTLAAGCGGGAGATVLRSSAPRATPDPAGEAPMAAAVNRFGLNLLRPMLGTSKGNVAVSAWSIATAILMARVGAAGATRSEMDAMFGFTDPAAVDGQLNALDVALTSRDGTVKGGDGKDHRLELGNADQIFVQKGFVLKAPFLATLASSYGTGVQAVDFVTEAEAARRAVNEWVADHTDGRISELLAEPIGLGTLMVLVNAVAFQADWATPFEPLLTRPGTFHRPGGDVDGPMMHEVTKGYAAGDGWRAATLPYVGGQLELSLVLPDEGRFDEVAAAIDPAAVVGRTDADRSIDLSLPKFEVTSSFSLASALASLGMPTAFTGAADFSAMTDGGGLAIGDVLHQADVKVDEKGTVAVAATADMMVSVGGPITDEVLSFDRPFLFFLRDRPTGTVLFSGQVTDPTRR